MSNEPKGPMADADAARLETSPEVEAATRVGWATMKDGTHRQLSSDEIDELMAGIEAADAKRKADMPTEQSAIQAMAEAMRRLRDFGWKEAIYCPKDGTPFDVIECGSTGIHDCHYQGEWPKGSWWVHSEGDLWPSRPTLFRLRDEQTAEKSLGITKSIIPNGLGDVKL